MALIEKLKNIANAIRSKTNKSEELTLEQMASEVRGIKTEPILEEQLVGIRSNGTTYIEPNDGFDGIGKAKIVTMVSGSNEGVDLTAIGCTPEETNEYNEYYKAGVEYAKNIYANWKNTSYKAGTYASNIDIVYFPKVDCSNMTDCQSMFSRALNLNVVYCLNWKPKSCDYTFQRTFKCRRIYGEIDFINATKALGFFFESGIEILPTIKNTYNLIEMRSFITGCFGLKEVYLDTTSNQNFYCIIQNCINLKKATITSLENATNLSIFCTETRVLEELYVGKYKQLDLSLAQQNLLKSQSIKYIIWHAMNGENTLGFENQGATSRTLQLHATPYTSWETWKLTKPSVEDCEFLGIDETEITKYGELTWEDISLNVKLITVGK